MCMVLLHFQPTKKCPLQLIFNRDESYTRSTATLAAWAPSVAGGGRIYGGRDLKAGGTWFACTPSGGFCCLTVYRDPYVFNPDRLSRGLLVTQYLEKHGEKGWLDGYLAWLETHSKAYNPFNILFGDSHEVIYFCSANRQSQRLQSGLHVLSNGELNNTWFKVQRLKALYVKEYAQEMALDHETLFSILHDDTRAPDDKLPNTGISKEQEHLISSIFIASEHYGTRASSILQFHETEPSVFIERNYAAGGGFLGDVMCQVV